MLQPSVSATIAPATTDPSLWLANPSGTLPVASCTNTIAYRSGKPPRLPTELIRATPPAAALPVSVAAGNGQKVGVMPEAAT
jgi:hypothetical protein